MNKFRFYLFCILLNVANFLQPAKSLVVISDDFVLNPDGEYFYNASYEIIDPGTPLNKLSFTTTLVKEIPEGVIGSIKIYKKGRETYRPLGAEISKDICVLLTTEKMFLPGLRRYGNIPKKCPLQVNSYYVTEYIVPVKDLPPVIPSGDFKFEFQMKIKNVTLVTGTWYGRVQPK